MLVKKIDQFDHYTRIENLDFICRVYQNFREAIETNNTIKFTCKIPVRQKFD